MVHRKIPRNSGPIYKTLKTAVLFPARNTFLKIALLAAHE